MAAENAMNNAGRTFYDRRGRNRAIDRLESQTSNILRSQNNDILQFHPAGLQLSSTEISQLPPRPETGSRPENNYVPLPNRTTEIHTPAEMIGAFGAAGQGLATNFADSANNDKNNNNSKKGIKNKVKNNKKKK